MPKKPVKLAVKVIAGIAGVMIAALVVSTGLVRQLVAAGEGIMAGQINPSDPLARAGMAEKQLGFDPTTMRIAGTKASLQASRSNARRALESDPLNAKALRVLSYGAAVQGENSDAALLARTGWRRDKRDTPTTLMIIATAAFDNGEQAADPKLAFDAVESLFRRRPRQIADFWPGILAVLERSPALREEMWARLRLESDWSEPVAVLIGKNGSAALISEVLDPRVSLSRSTDRSIRLSHGERLLGENQIARAAQVLAPLLAETSFPIPLTITAASSQQVLSWQTLAVTGASASFSDTPVQEFDTIKHQGSAYASFLGSGGAADVFSRGLLLPAGDYIVDFATKTQATGGFYVRIFCSAGLEIVKKPILADTLDTLRRDRLQFSVPTEGCPITRIAVGVEGRSDLRPINLQISFGEVSVAGFRPGREPTPPTAGASKP